MLKEENKFLMVERKIFRKILELIKEDDGAWLIRKYLEIADLVYEANIMGKTKSARLRWIGHVEWPLKDQSREHIGVNRLAEGWLDVLDIAGLLKPTNTCGSFK